MYNIAYFHEAIMYNVTINNNIATISSSDFASNAQQSLKSLEGAERIILGDGLSKNAVVDSFKQKLLSEIKPAQRIWEQFLALFFGCTGYLTTTQKVEKLCSKVLNKSFEVIKEPVLFSEELIEEALDKDEGFKAVAVALKRERFEQARLLVYKVNFKDEKLSIEGQKLLIKYITLKEVDYLLAKGFFNRIYELIIYIPDKDLRKKILLSVEKANAEQRFPQIRNLFHSDKEVMQANAGARFEELMEAGKLDEAIDDLKGKEPSRIVAKLFDFYLKSDCFEEARALIPFSSNIDEFTLKLGEKLLKADKICECLEIYGLLEDDAEASAKLEMAKTLYSHDMDLGRVLWVLNEAPKRDAALLELVSAALNHDNFIDAHQFINQMASQEVKEAALKKVEVKRQFLEKKASLALFAEDYVNKIFTSALEEIDHKKVVEDLDLKIKQLDTLEKQYACYDYLAGFDHFELAYAFALKSPRRLALKTDYGLYKEGEFEAKIKRWLPKIPAINDQKDIDKVMQELNQKKMRQGLYDYALIYFKGILIQSYIKNCRFDEARALAKTVRFADFRLGVEKLC